MKSSTLKRTPRGGEWRRGNAMLLSILLISFMAALAAAQFTVVHRNVQSSSFFLSRSDLHKYAESGIDLAVHDLRYDVSGNGGMIGVNGWTVGNDLGRDGIYGTYDEGEGDGVPTPGEANVAPVSVGGSELQAGLMVYVADTIYPDVKRVVSTATNGQTLSTVDTYVLKTIISVPKVAAVYVDPAVVLDLKGNAFMIDGNDHNLDGTKNGNPALPGIGTEDAATPGENRVNILSQIPAGSYDQVIGDGGAPSVDEVGTFKVNDVFDAFKGAKTQTYAAGTYSSPTMGSLAGMEVTYVSGDLHLSGNGSGAGVLLVDGSLEMTGQFTYHGLVIVRGDVRMSGGGSGKHIYGSLLVGQSVTAVDPLLADNLTISGTADLFYSSEMLDRVNSFLTPSYAVVYYDEK